MEKYCPGLLKATIEWFKIYKIPDGKPENQFAFSGEAKTREFALHIIDEVHQHWQNLIKQESSSGEIDWFVKTLIFKLCFATKQLKCYSIYYFYSSNVTVEGSPFKITTEAAEQILEKAPEPVEPQPVEPIGK